MLSSNITRNEKGTVCFAGQPTDRLAEVYGTPLYLMDEERVRANCRMYIRAFEELFPPGSRVLYAGKAASFKTICRIVAQEGMGLDAVSVGELHTALSAGFPPEDIYFQGDGKTDADIRYALAHGVGCFVVDNREELDALSAMAAERGIRQKILVRVTPGIDPHTYEAVNTGTVDVKFGTPIQTGQAMDLLRQALASPGVELAGLHSHVGSEVFDEGVFQDLCDVMVDFMSAVRAELGWTAGELDLGGGYGVRYVDADPTADIPRRIGEVSAHLHERIETAGLPMPRVLMEPGRSIVADAGMTVYTVSAVKHIPGVKNYVIVDGGMADNPRYCLYGARYTVLHGDRESEETETFDLAGRCCENGDILQPGVRLPADVRRGDHICVCTTGAYNYSMASNYNRLGRPPVVMLRAGESYVAVRRETAEDLCALDL